MHHLLWDSLSSQVAQELYVIIRLCQLSLQTDDFRFELIYQLHLGVLVFDRLIAYKASLSRVCESAQVLLNIGVRGREAGYHQAVGVAPDTLLQEASQLGVTVRNMLERLEGTGFGGLSSGFCQGCNDLS